MFNLNAKGKSVEHITTVGIDLAKNVFSLHGVDPRAGQSCSARCGAGGWWR